MTDEIDQTPKRRKRVRSPHPGVKLKPPRANQRMEYWRAVYSDPDTGRDKYERLDPQALTNDKARREWAIRKSRAIAKRKLGLELGAPRATGTSFEKGIAQYYENAAHVRAATLADYKTSTNNLLAWAKRECLDLDSLTRAKLIEFRTYALKLPKRRRMKGGKRGEQTEVNGGRAMISVNGDLRVARQVLAWLRMMDKLPKLTTEDLDVALKRYKQDENTPEFLSPRELRETFVAAANHDASVFILTRNEKKKLGQRADSKRGATPRHNMMAPLVMAATLTGMRLDELCLIEWATHIDLDALSFDGKIIGEIKLRAQDTKTHKSRTVSFDVSPALRELLVVLRRVNGGKGLVFGITYDEAQKAMQRLKNEYNAPARFSFQILRSTCSTFLTNAPAIYGAASPFHSARQLGHSVEVAEKHYTGLIRGISREARTLEAAMQIETEVADVIKRLSNSLVRDNVVQLRNH